MSITGSMYNGISGLQAQSQATLVVSNNLANSSTVGFKSSSVIFQDVFYETVNAGQTGNGVSVANIDTDFSQGSYQSTGSNTDLAITGDGYFMVKDPNNGAVYYTRAGNFDFDEEGYLVDPEGNRVQGWEMENGSPTGAIGDIKIDDSQSPPKATNSIQMSLNLNASAEDNSTATVDDNGTPGDPTDDTTSCAYTALFDMYDGTASPPLDQSRYEYQSTITVYDEAGGTHELTVYMDPVSVDADGNTVWEYTVASNPGEDMREGFEGTEAAGLLMAGTITFSPSGAMSSMTAYTPVASTGGAFDGKDPSNWTLAEFDDAGVPLLEANFSGSDENQKISMNFGMVNKDHDTGNGWAGAVDNDSDGAVTLADLQNSGADVDYTDLPGFNDPYINYSATTCYESSSATLGLYQDGFSTGTLQNVTVDQAGAISGEYSNGQTIQLYNLGIADFANEDGLSAQGGNKFLATAESGEAIVGIPGVGGMGGILSNTLEISNVDMAQEMTNLIILQSAYQANSKVITTADTLLQTAINLKRN
ncbi:flagellar hook protein FlgE [Halodesulfovibrio marinisediminis]|uniref:Flagellar hook protein FlgE n=1 Tax=Halodesulfovibrio marinisediminis DSM 17456 TaxID=1121457 RepID=A0A1N6GTM2_9BACT|nr:flagellar hook protein FlgE [Halodesulfovibrio marinisediminis]SIO10930.1 flagellar hook protein FlgE [Halodesulfovibrio marinisediminis DSM 17456]